MNINKYRHVEAVVKAIKNFPGMMNNIEDIYEMCEDTNDLEADYEMVIACQAGNLMEESIFELANEIMFIEHDIKTRHMMEECIEHYLKSAEATKFLSHNITAEESRKYALAIDILDEYLLYLSGSKWNGPFDTNFNKNADNIDMIRNELGLKKSDYIKAMAYAKFDYLKYDKIKRVIDSVKDKSVCIETLLISFMLNDKGEGAE